MICLNCCEKCFNDIKLKKLFRHEDISNCSYCGSENVRCRDEFELYELFTHVFDLYENINKNSEIYPLAKKTKSFIGQPLVKLIQNDWNIFNEDNLNYSDISKFIYNISRGTITEEESRSDIWVKKVDIFYGYYTSKDWYLFCENLKHKNRFFSRIEYEYEHGYKSHFEEVLSNLEVFKYVTNSIPKGDSLYRARIGCDIDKKTNSNKPFKYKDLGIPPENILTNGRANPLGINYLYTSDNIRTVLSEVRAWKGSIVTVAKMIVKKKLIIVDLTDIIKIDSPFSFWYDDLFTDIQVIDLLESFAKELSEPIDPNKSSIDYIPTQYICELIKNKGYDGIKFKSSLSDGNNIVLFSEEKIKIISANLHKVTKIVYESEPM